MNSKELDNLKEAIALNGQVVQQAINIIDAFAEAMKKVEADPSILQTLADELNARTKKLTDSLAAGAATQEGILNTIPSAVETPTPPVV